MKVSAASLANLRPVGSEGGIKDVPLYTKENANEMRERGLVSRLRNKELREQFKLTAKAFMQVKEELPEVQALDVIKMAMWTALQEDDFESAAKYAEKVAEYEQPKLQRIDQTVTSKTVDLTDEELMEIIEKEGLSLSAPKAGTVVIPKD